MPKLTTATVSLPCSGPDGAPWTATATALLSDDGIWAAHGDTLTRDGVAPLPRRRAAWRLSHVATGLLACNLDGATRDDARRALAALERHLSPHLAAYRAGDPLPVAARAAALDCGDALELAGCRLWRYSPMQSRATYAARERHAAERDGIDTTGLRITAAVRAAADAEGYPSVGAMLADSLVGDCVAVCSKCHATRRDLEPDARGCRCESCGRRTVTSVLTLAGVC